MAQRFKFCVNEVLLVYCPEFKTVSNVAGIPVDMGPKLTIIIAEE